MQIEELIKDKSKKPKEKTELISTWLVSRALPLDELLAFASGQKDPAKASCIEAIEYATRQDVSLADRDVLDFVSQALTEKAPRIKWESAKVVGNIARLFPEHLAAATANLLKNTQHDGTVVRWSAAFALGEILKLKTAGHRELLSEIQAICTREEKNSIRKIYLDAIKRSEK